MPCKRCDSKIVMIKLKINNIDIEVPKGTTIFRAAEKAGIEIPSICFGDESFTNHPSCMICVVKETSTGKLHPSCAYPVFDGMNIITDDKEIHESRKEALELLLSDHVGDCEAPCRIACPAFMDIPEMNRLIAQSKFDEAIKIVKQEIVLPLILGYICSAPCEKVCRRKDADQAVSICLLKRFVAQEDFNLPEQFIPKIDLKSNKEIAIIGSGISGLACAFHLIIKGHSVTVFEKEEILGGSLNTLPENELPKDALKLELNYLKNLGVNFKKQTIDSELLTASLQKEFDATIIASGANSASNFPVKSNERGIQINKDTFETDISGVFACGSAVQPVNMAVRALAQGKNTAIAVNQFLNGNQPKKIAKPFNSKFGKLLNSEVVEYLKEASPIKRKEPKNGSLEGFSKDEAIEEAKRCMHCDCRKRDNCKLRDCASMYDVDQKKYSLGNRKEVQKIETHNEVIYEPEKCIKCGLCIEITKKYNDGIGLTYIGRGFDVRIQIPFNEKLEEALKTASNECVTSCPTGAMAYKNS